MLSLEKFTPYLIHRWFLNDFILYHFIFIYSILAHNFSLNISRLQVTHGQLEHGAFVFYWRFSLRLAAADEPTDILIIIRGSTAPVVSALPVTVQGRNMQV